MTTEYLNNKVFESNIIRFQKAKKNKSKLVLILEDFSDSYKRKMERSSHTPEDKKRVEATAKLFRAAEMEFSATQQILATAFYILAQQIVSYAKFHMIDPDDAVQDCVLVCFDKVDRFDPRKGKAFNYLTTCSLNQLRQSYRGHRNYNELKRKYQEFMHNKTGNLRNN